MHGETPSSRDTIRYSPSSPDTNASISACVSPFFRGEPLIISVFTGRISQAHRAADRLPSVLRARRRFPAPDNRPALPHAQNRSGFQARAGSASSLRADDDRARVQMPFRQDRAHGNFRASQSRAGFRHRRPRAYAEQQDRRSSWDREHEAYPWNRRFQ